MRLLKNKSSQPRIKARFKTEVPRQTRHSLKILLLAAMSVGFFIFHIWFRTEVITVGYEVGARRLEVNRLEADLVNLKVERDRLMGPESLERTVRSFASRGIVFGAPKARQLIYLKAEAPPETAPAKDPR